MKCRRTPNGKTMFDLRNQYRRVMVIRISRDVRELKKLIADGIITTQEQYDELRRKQKEKDDKFFQWYMDYIYSVGGRQLEHIC